MTAEQNGDWDWGTGKEQQKVDEVGREEADVQVAVIVVPQ